jgi:hypothetical protein
MGYLVVPTRVSLADLICADRTGKFVCLTTRGMA